MRSMLSLAVVLGAFGSVAASPAGALERLPKPDPGAGLITLVADLDPGNQVRGPRYRGGDQYWNWRYRAAYTRWMHNEYSRAGYPVEHRQYRTYRRVVPCCSRW